MQKAQAPIHKLGNDEYFRALEGHKTIRKPTEDFLPKEIMYMIDKEIRMKFRREKEEKESNENAFSNSQIEILKKSSSDKTSFKE